MPKKPSQADANPTDLLAAASPDAPPNKPQAVAQSIPPPDKTRTWGFVMGHPDLVKTGPKYPSLQIRQVLQAKLDPDLVELVIDVLEDTNWSQSQFGNLVFRQQFYMNDAGFYNFINELLVKGYFERDDIESLRYIRDKLKPIALGLQQLTATTISKFSNGRRHNP